MEFICQAFKSIYEILFHFLNGQKETIALQQYFNGYINRKKIFKTNFTNVLRKHKEFTQTLILKTSKINLYTPEK